MSALCQNRTQAAARVHAICITRALGSWSGGFGIVMPSIPRPPPYAGRLVDAACWSDGAKFSLPLDSDAPGPCAGGCGADAGRARMAEQLSTCARRIRSRRAEPDAGSAELRPRSARARARVLPAPCAIARYDER